MIEIELKATLNVEQAAVLPARLTALGFTAQQPVEETDLYWNGVDRDFCKTDEALRLRRARNADGTESAFLTYKGTLLDAETSSRQEHELRVDSADCAERLLRALGYQPTRPLRKLRRSYFRGTICACLDEIAELGTFLELEILLPDITPDDASAVAQLFALLDRLGVSRSALTQKSYLDQLLSLPPNRCRK